MSEIRIRRLVYSDLPAVLSIERRSFETPWSLAMFVLELSKPLGICLAAATDEGLVGYLVCSRYADVWHLMNVAVPPDKRRHGIASRLLERLFEEAGPTARYTLEVRTSNLEAIALYEKLGFERRGARRGYYTDNREDALVMCWRRRRPWKLELADPWCRDVVRRHLRRGHRRRADPLNVISSQAAAHALQAWSRRWRRDTTSS